MILTGRIHDDVVKTGEDEVHRAAFLDRDFLRQQGVNVCPLGSER